MERKKFIILFLFFSVAFGTVKMKAQLGDRIVINGYSSFEFEKQFGDEGKGDPNGSFDVDLFDLVLNVFATNRLRVAADLTWEHGAATEDGRGNVAVEYAFGEYALYKQLKFRAGKMFTHFGIYNEIHTAKPAFLTVKEPLSTNKNEKFGSEIRFYPRWIAGLAVLGNTTIGEMDMDYIVQLANGEQGNTNPFEEDDNKEKAIAGRVHLYPLRNIELGLSFYTDRITELDSIGGDSGARTNLLSYGGHTIVKVADWGFEVEYAAGYVKPTMTNKVTRNALTGMVFYSIKDFVVPYLRYEYLDPNIDIHNDIARMFVYGINIQLDDGLFVKAELNTVNSGQNNIRFNGNNFTELKAAIAIGF